MTPPFLDSNILLYHLLGVHPEFAKRCKTLLDELTIGNSRATCSISVISETVYVLEKSAWIPRHEIIPPLREIVELRSIWFEHRDAILDALDYWLANGPLSFSDCYHLALADQLGCEQIYTFDRKMDRYPGIERIEP